MNPASSIRGRLSCIRAIAVTSIVCLGPGLSFSRTVSPVHFPIHGLPVTFEQNRGQAPAAARYLARIRNGEAWLLPNGLEFVREEDGRRQEFQLHFEGSLAPDIRQEDPTGGVANYFAGRDRAKWIPNIPMYRAVRYSHLYPGIDVVFHGNSGRLEYDFDLAAGASPEAIRIDLGESAEVNLEKGGNLVVKQGERQLRLLSPEAFQPRDDAREKVSASYVILGAHKVGFRLGNYDHGRRLIIDPVVAYANLLEAGGSFQVSGAAVDSLGDLILAGSTYGSSYPVVNGLVGEVNSSEEVFVTKLDPSGENILYSTYLPASGFTTATGIAADPAGNAYIIGTTGAYDFPVTSINLGTCTPQFCNAGFVTRLDSTGAISYSTLLASGQILPDAIAVSKTGDAYVAGLAADGSLHTVNAFDADYEGGLCTSCYSAFFARLNASGTQFVYASYLGSQINALGIAVDDEDNLYVAGLATGVYGPVVPLKKEFQSGLGDFFLTKFASDGKTLLFSSYLGGQLDNPEPVEGLAGLGIGKDGTVYLGGETSSVGFPYTLDAYRHPLGAPFYTGQVFAMAINPELTALKYSTYLGDGNMYRMAIDATGNLYAIGDMLVAPPVEAQNAVAADLYPGAMFLELDTTGHPVQLSSFGGHDDGELPEAMAVDAEGNAYLAGPRGSGTTTAPSGCAPPDPILVGAAAYAAQAASQESCASGNGDEFFARISPRSAPQISLGYALPFLPLHNAGSSDLHIRSLSFTGGISKAGGTCGSTVPAGTTCVLTLTDSNGALAAGSLTITSDASPATQTFTPYLNPDSVGTRVGDMMWIDSSNLSFPPQQMGTSGTPQPVKIWNAGLENLTIQSISASGWLSQTNNCSTVKPGGYCTVEVAPEPKSEELASQITVNYDHIPGPSYSIYNSYLTSPTPLMLSQTGPIPFGTQTVGNPSMYRTVTVTNVSNRDVDAPRSSVGGGSGFQLAGSTCSGTLKPHQSCVAAAVFNPKQPGNYSANLIFAGSISASIDLSGTAQSAAGISLSALQLQWPPALLGSSATESLTLTNGSQTSAPVTIEKFALPDFSQTDNCAQSLAAHSACTIRVRFEPTRTGERTDLLIINLGSAAGEELVPVSGVGQFPIGIAPASIDFGLDNPVGKTSSPQHVTISNLTGASHTWKVTATGPFELSNPCPTTLPARSSCVLAVSFKPEAAGELAGSLKASIPGTAQANSIPMGGTAYSPPFMKVGTSSFNFEDVTVGTASFPMQDFLTDTGSRQINIAKFSFSGADAKDFSVAPGSCTIVAGDGSCSISIVFTPSAAGVRSATLAIDSDATNSPGTILLTGTGLQ